MVKMVSRTEAKRHIGNDERIAMLNQTVMPFESRHEYVSEISRLWSEAQLTFLTIGRYLVQAAEKLEHGEYQAMVETELPFGYQVSYQLRKVAEAIDGKRFQVEELPPSYATVFQLTTLTDEQLAVARQQEPPLLRPSVQRHEVIEFKKAQGRATRGDAPPTENRAAQLQRRRATLVKQQNKITSELQEIDDELSLLQ